MALPERSASAAVTAIQSGLQRVLSCVSSTVVIVSPEGHRPTAQTNSLTLPQRTVRLAGEARISFGLRYTYCVEESLRRAWDIVSVGYYYVLEDQSEREILAYHWHPHIAQIPFPHLHVGVGAGIGRRELSAAHLPTGHVELRDVVRLAVRDFGVTPLRDDWRDLLDADA